MKAMMTISIDYELKQELSNEDNASGLINSLVKGYFESRMARKAGGTGEEEIVENVKRIMGLEKERDAENQVHKKVLALIETIPKDPILWQEYQEGLKDKKWKGLSEYAKIKIGNTK